MLNLYLYYVYFWQATYDQVDIYATLNVDPLKDIIYILVIKRPC
jgi:hypothetical protein